ncbi:AhpC/TSA family protein [Nonlabens xylanidelens]|uniref:AhpC/TSA family protein n=1 Tax=Nonlabens xylanidelens TaxID=191564 RepID=A0A2S6IRD3_9FLAO|nr:TlpA disulfide reductase family protein [Nonlabens xylanidelens]PPK96768.1 AhpC/TSA family protein [Nonlabens xylanidelens]PQJ13475.1 hypothetical protein BST94_14035 [Nonlabens xylanidelens]
MCKFSIFLAFVFCVLLSSCKPDNKNKELSIPEVALDSLIDSSKKDSLTITVELPAESSVILNMVDKYSQHFIIEHINKTDQDSVFETTILNPHKNQLIKHGMRMFGSSKFDRPSTSILISDTTSVLSLVYKDDKLSLTQEDMAPDVTRMVEAYDSLQVAVFKWKGDDSKFMKSLDSIKNLYDFQYSSNTFNVADEFSQIDEERFKAHKALNKYGYYSVLQKLDFQSTTIDSIIKNEFLYMPYSDGSGVVFIYLRNEIENIPFDSLNNPFYTQEYRDNLTHGLVKFLSFSDYKRADKYLDAKEWLRTTDYYKENSKQIERLITPMDKKKFKSLLSKFELQDVDSTTILIKDVIKNHPSKYYMIDLWATWCAPCISNMKMLEKMSLPKSLTIINVSTDKLENWYKWKEMTLDLGHDVTYFAKRKSDVNKEFLDFIEIKSIPRYVLFDKDLKLIDHDFYAPYEPQFKSKIGDLKNHKYW